MPKARKPQLHSELLQARVTPDFLKAVTKAAASRGMTVPDYLRAVMAEAVFGPHLPKRRAAKARKGGRA